MSARAAPIPIAMRTILFTRGLFPVLDGELGLTLALAVGDLQFQVLRAHALLELEIGAALVVDIVRTLAREERHQLVVAHLEVAEIDAVHAALHERLGLTR